MSIAQNLERIKKAKYAIRSAAVAKGAVISETARIEEYAPAIAKISTSGGEAVDLSFVTAAASDILSGKVGADANGKPISGSMPYSNIGVTGNVVLIQRGYTPEDETVIIPEAQAPGVSGNVVTVYPGYLAEQKKITVGTTKAAATITPGTSDQTIAAGTYLSGKQTIKGDADLKAANIKKGVQIFNVTGSYEGEGGTFELAKVTEFSPATQPFSGLSQIVVSGLGGGYDTANGTYYVTTETEKETDPFKRIYKHASGEWFIWGEYNSEYEEGYFYIGPAENSGSLCSWTNEEFTDGEYYFEDWDLGDSFDVSLDVTKTNYPEIPMVLKGVKVIGYTDKTWIFSDEVIQFTGFEITPAVGYIYNVSGTELIGYIVGNSAINDFSVESALFALDSWRGLNDLVSDTAPTGYGVDDASAVLKDGVFCFDHKQALQYEIGESMSALNDFTIEMDYTITSGDYGYCGFFGNRTSWTNDCICLQWGRSGYRPSLHWNGVEDGLTGGKEHGDWINDGKYHHVALVRHGATVYLFSDGKLLGTAGGAGDPLNLAAEGMLTVGVQLIERAILPGKMKHFRIVPIALYTADFSNNIPSWVGA